MTTQITTDFTPAEETTQHMASYVLSLPERRMGSWDDNYIRVVTGYGWDHWYMIFNATRGFEAIFRSLTTRDYLLNSDRFDALQTKSQEA